MMKLRRKDEALLATALTGFTCSSVELVNLEEDKKNLIIRWVLSNTGILNTYPTVQINMVTHPSILLVSSELLIYP